MSRSLSTHGGNDSIQTPIHLAQKIVDHFKPEGQILEPCCGDGNFLSVLPKDSDWCEINKGRDFLTIEGHWDWIVTNPPYSRYREFLRKGMEVADNIIFLQLVNATFYRARLRDIQQMNFGIKEIWCLDTPREFPQFGFQMGCVHYQRGYSESILFTFMEVMR